MDCSRGGSPVCEYQIDRGFNTQLFAGNFKNPGMKPVAYPALYKSVWRSYGYPCTIDRALKRLDPGDKLLLPELFRKKRETVLPELVHSSLSGGAALTVVVHEIDR